jgi:hypothetical protein
MCMLRVWESGMPVLMVSSMASSSAWARIASWILVRAAWRSATVAAPHGPLSKAVLAALTAASTSSAEDSSNVATLFSVVGSMTAISSAPAGLANRPDM